jgi:excinuclease ABC subunit B
MTERQLGREIKRLEKQMLDLAKNLQFEKAAQVRDQLATLRGRVFGLDGDVRGAELGQAA